MDRTGQCEGAKSALNVIAGKWKPSILFLLSQRETVRFNELMRLIPDITQKMLTANLRELEEHHLVVRTVYPEVPPRVEYALTEYGRSAMPIIDSLQQWGNVHRSHKEAQ